jgi:hypothetical protein
MSKHRPLFWTRKDIARVLEMSVQAVRCNEKALGLSRARRVFNQRVIRYRTSLAIRALERLRADLAPYPRGERLSDRIKATRPV